jgi:hypothetical protein
MPAYDKTGTSHAAARLLNRGSVPRSPIGRRLLAPPPRLPRSRRASRPCQYSRSQPDAEYRLLTASLSPSSRYPGKTFREERPSHEYRR